MKDRRLLTIALASVFTLVSTIALAGAGAAHHKPNARTYDLHAPQVRSRVLHPNDRNPDGTVSAGGYLWNGRSASEWGGG
jgi:hypothetical protein